jgi:soluble lytic murein transglycosylase-like protein
MSVHALPNAVARLIDEAADRYSVPRPLARGVAWIESRGVANAVSPAGAQGIMQLMPATAKSLGVNALDPVQNVDGGVRYLAQLLARYGERAGLAAYNWGPGNVAKHGGKDGETHWPIDVKTYVTNVLQRAEYELAMMGDGAAAAPLASASSSSQPPPAQQPSSDLRSPQPKGGEPDDA